MTPRRKIFTFAIDEDLAAGLKSVKEEQGIPESEQVRRALRAWLQPKGVTKATSRRASTRRKV